MSLVSRIGSRSVSRFVRIIKNDSLGLLNRVNLGVVAHCRNQEHYKTRSFELLGLGGMVLFSSISLCTSIDFEESDLALKAEDLYQDNSYSRIELLRYIREAVSESPQDINLLWRLARAAYDVSNLSSTAEAEKKKLIYEAYDIIKKTYDLSTSKENYAVHKWYGIILSSIGDYEGSKVAIANSYIIRDHWMEAVRLKPDDSTSHHLLGRWCFSIAEISWIERKVAAAIFGSPPQSSYKEALDHFEHAEKISPGTWKKNSLMIAKCYYNLKEYDNAKIWLQRALSIKINKEEDEEVHDEALSLFKKI